MPTWTDENGDVVASTTFTDAQGRRYINGVDVSEAAWDEHQAVLYRLETTEAISRTHLAHCRFVKQDMREEADVLRRALSTLVRLKDGPRDSAYLAAKQAAWQAAREALGRHRLALVADDD